MIPGFTILWENMTGYESLSLLKTRSFQTLPQWAKADSFIHSFIHHFAPREKFTVIEKEIQFLT